MTITNFRLNPQNNFPVSYQINGGPIVTEMYSADPIPSASSDTYTFTSTANLAVLGEYSVKLWTALSTNEFLANDTSHTEVENFICAPSGDGSFGDGFTSFMLRTIDNSSGCSARGYEDYTALSTNLARDAKHTVTVTSGWAEQFFSVWIDYNDNFFFEPEEQVISSFESDLGASTTFFLPADAPLGEHLLRTKSSDVEDSVGDPCTDMVYGETEDYTVNIIPAESGDRLAVDFTGITPGGTVSFTDLSTGSPDTWAWSVSPSTGITYTGATSAKSQNPKITFGDAGIYSISLTASNSSG